MHSVKLPVLKEQSAVVSLTSALVNFGQDMLDTNIGITKLLNGMEHDDDRTVWFNVVRQIILRDIIENGIPIEYFHPTITVYFRKEDWVFDLEILKMLDLARFVSDPSDRITDLRPGEVHAVNLARVPILIPDVNGRLYSAKHASATILLNEFFGAHADYIIAQNQLLQFIAEHPLTNADSFLTYWSTIFSTGEMSGSTIRTKL